MADKAHKQESNAAGAYYVDTQCVDCDLCRQSAPFNFRRNEEKGYSYVYKQPENEQEIDKVKLALSECPVEAIGSDG
ncbi:MAG: ferredoxin [Candidatus Omnitrophica bacterium]|nr:ferredoxin [Candidatus Omnitrophota bacterium]